MDTLCGTKLVVSVKMWESGFRKNDGTECDNVGHRVLGESYLQRTQLDAYRIKLLELTSHS